MVLCVLLYCCSGSEAKHIILLNKDFPCITVEANCISSFYRNKHHHPDWERWEWGLREWSKSHFVIHVLQRSCQCVLIGNYQKSSPDSAENAQLSVHK